MMYCSMGHDFRSTDDANGAGACNAPQVIALDIDDHRQLRVFFGILVEFADQKPILIGAFSTRPSSLDRTRVKSRKTIGIYW